MDYYNDLPEQENEPNTRPEGQTEEPAEAVEQPTGQTEEPIETSDKPSERPQGADGSGTGEKEETTDKPSEQPQAAQAADTAATAGQSKKKSIMRLLRTEKFKRGGMATLLTVIFVAVVVVINILVSLLTDRFPSMNIDMTAQGFNTLSEQAQTVAEGVQNETRIYLIGSEDAYRKDQLYSSYGLEFSQVANLAERLVERNPLISMEFVDPDLNPDFISKYADESLTSGCVLVETDKRHKVLRPDDLFDMTQDSSTGQIHTYTNVDSSLAGAMEIANMDKVPVVAIALGHGDMLDGSLNDFTTLMERQNYEVTTFNILTEELPENTQILMLPTPTNDYSEGELEKLRAYMDDEERKDNLNLIVTCHPQQGELPNLARFLEEWGVRVEPGMVYESDDSRQASYDEAFVLMNPNTDVMDGSYSLLTAPYSSPLTVLFSGVGDIGAQWLWQTADTGYVVTDDMTEAEKENPSTGVQTTATVSIKYVQLDGEDYRRNLFVFGSSYVFIDNLVNTSAFDNGQYITDLMRYGTGTGGSSVTVYSNPVQTNTMDISMSAQTITLLGLGVFTIGLPVVILIVGLVIFLKRRHL